MPTLTAAQAEAATAALANHWSVPYWLRGSQSISPVQVAFRECLPKFAEDLRALPDVEFDAALDRADAHARHTHALSGWMVHALLGNDESVRDESLRLPRGDAAKYSRAFRQSLPLRATFAGHAHARTAISYSLFLNLRLTADGAFDATSVRQ